METQPTPLEHRSIAHLGTMGFPGATIELDGLFGMNLVVLHDDGVHVPIVTVTWISSLYDETIYSVVSTVYTSELEKLHRNKWALTILTTLTCTVLERDWCNDPLAYLATIHDQVDRIRTYQEKGKDVTQPATATPTAFPDMGKRVKQAIDLRDKIKAIQKRQKEELKPYLEVQEQLEMLILSWLNATNSKNVATEHGTAYITTRNSATVGDMEAFWNFVKEKGLFDLVDKRANAPAVAEFIEANGHAPPGVNFRQMQDVNVRRS